MRDMNFAHISLDTEVLETFLNGFPPEHPFHDPRTYEANLDARRYEDYESLAHIMASAGVFPSVGQARKNGWGKPIPDGFSQYVVGKRKILITIVGKNCEAFKNEQ